MSCKIKLNVPFAIGEVIAETLKEMSLLRGSFKEGDKTIYLNNGSYFSWNEKNQVYDLMYEDFYRKGQESLQPEIDKFLNTFSKVHEKQFVLYEEREKEKARQAKIAAYRAKMEEIKERARKAGYTVTTQIVGNKEKLILSRFS